MNFIIKIILICIAILFIIENLGLAYLWYVGGQEIENTNICYYDICEEYPDALYEEGVCFCRDYDIIGNLVVVETEVMN